LEFFCFGVSNRRPAIRRVSTGAVTSTRRVNNLERKHDMNYIDGFVVPVRTTNREAYRQLAQMAAGIFKENGALSVVECWGDDVPEGKVTSFPMAVKREEGETVVFSWVAWPSKAVRDVGMKKVMEDKRMQNSDMPFDGKRMIYGGFEVIVNA
jgi:uncharacterized protein YbaA (DUF1428 family)